MAAERTLEDFSALVRMLYEAAANPSLWPDFLNGFQTALQTQNGRLTTLSPDPRLNVVLLNGYGDREIAAYQSHWTNYDIVLQAGIRAVHQHGEWVGRLEAILPEQTLLSSAVYQEYLAPQQHRYLAGIAQSLSGAMNFAAVSVWRRSDQKPFSEDDMFLLRLLAPHARQAFELHARLALARSESAALEAGVEACGMGLIALDSNKRVLHLSQWAESLLARKDGLELREGRLHATRRDTDRQLQSLLDGAVNPDALDGSSSARTRTGGGLQIPREVGARPLQAFITLMSPSAHAFDCRPAAVVFLRDPLSSPANPGEALKEVYGLTPTEARICTLLAEGAELKKIADRMSTSYHAVRFHLKQVFRKTGTSRQSDLVKLLAAIPCLAKMG